MPTPRKPTTPTTEALDQFCQAFDDLFGRYAERTAVRHSLIGLLLPREHNKTVVELAAIVPGANRQQLQHCVHDAPWDAEALNRRRLQLWQAHPSLGPHAGSVLIVDETGDPKRGHRIVLAAQQYVGKLGHVANGVVWGWWPSPVTGPTAVAMCPWASNPTGQRVACPGGATTRRSTPSRSWAGS